MSDTSLGRGKIPSNMKFSDQSQVLYFTGTRNDKCERAWKGFLWHSFPLDGAGQWNAGEPALWKKVLMGNFCQFPWCKFSHYDRFQVTKSWTTSLQNSYLTISSGVSITLAPVCSWGWMQQTTQSFRMSSQQGLSLGWLISYSLLDRLVGYLHQGQEASILIIQ